MISPPGVSGGSGEAPQGVSPIASLTGWTLALGLFSYEVAHGALSWADQQVAQWVATLRSPALDELMRGVTVFGTSTWVLLSLSGFSVWMWRQQKDRVALLRLMGACGVGLLIEASLRLWVLHYRPGVIALPSSMRLATRFQLAGFPSGHAFRSAFVFGWLARELHSSRTWWTSLAKGLCLAIIGLVGLTRLYLNRHWASDVLGGWLVALVALSLARCWEQGTNKRVV